MQNKAQVRVFDALQYIRRRFPIDLRGIDSDNGSEFINNELWRYCEQEHLTFTRGRVGRKNDNPFVEQKNWSVTRHLIGYDRYDTTHQVQQLNALYQFTCLYSNHFLPVAKLIAKRRDGSRVIKTFDTPKTPYQRILDSPDVSASHKTALKKEHAKLDVVRLKEQIDAALDVLKPSKVPPLKLR